MSQKKDAKDRLLEQIISIKMGKLFYWKKPDLIETIGPEFANAFDDFEGVVETIDLNIRELLSAYSLDDLQVRFDMRGRPKSNGFWDEDRWIDFLESEISYYNLNIPPWFSAGFGNVDYRADCKYWAQQAYYDYDELALLTIGVDPMKTNWASITKLGEASGKDCWQSINFLEKRRILLERKFVQIPKQSNKITPDSFLEYVDDVGLEIDEEFRHELCKIYRPNTVRVEFDPREKIALLKLVYIMAMDGYRFNPNSKRTELPKELFEVAELNGVKISRDTIRKHLYASAKPYLEPWKTE